MRERIEQAMRHAVTLGASYADIRWKDIVTEYVRVEYGQLTNIESDRDCGFGVRVYADGAMGFAASAMDGDLIKTVAQAYNTALASRTLLTNKAVLSEKQPVKGSYATPVEIDPFTIPLAEKLELLFGCDKIMRETEGVTKTTAAMSFRKERVVFADTDGSYIEQEFCQSHGEVSASALSDSDVQERSWNNYLRAGYEAVLGFNLKEHAERVAKECVALLNAPDCPSGVYDLVITPRQMFLQIHESVGHPTELDRVLGSEAAFAGMSFVTTNYLNEPLKYGSEHVTIQADAFSEKGLGTFGWDDEGTPAQCVTLVDNGMFKGYQTSRDNAPIVGQVSSGAGLADGWWNIPIVRMTNINLLPGDYELDDLIAGVENGFLLDENKSWSIDDKRINFQFACEMAREIKDGKLTRRVFKNPIYAGKTTEFWGSCDGVCNEKYWQIIGVPNCGKGQPAQIMRVAHGSAPARFRNVKVGVADVK
jgi:TldD protein